MTPEQLRDIVKVLNMAEDALMEAGADVSAELVHSLLIGFERVLRAKTAPKRNRRRA